MIRKEKNFDNFLNDKITNLSKASKENIVYSNRIFNEFCEKTHNKTTDEIIKEARQDEKFDKMCTRLENATNELHELNGTLKEHLRKSN